MNSNRNEKLRLFILTTMISLMIIIILMIIEIEGYKRLYYSLILLIFGEITISAMILFKVYRIDIIRYDFPQTKDKILQKPLEKEDYVRKWPKIILISYGLFGVWIIFEIINSLKASI